MANEKLIIGKDSDGNEVKVLVRKPSQQDYKDSQIEYNKAWRSALDSGAMLREQLTARLIKEGVWTAEKQEQYEKLANEINSRESIIKKGSIPLKKARRIALELKGIRSIFRDLLAEKIAYDNNSVEGQADNARFDAFVALCTLDPNTKKRIFKSVEEYNEKANEPWAAEAASEIANMMYNIETNFEDKFLSKFKMVDSEGRLINKEGHLIYIDDDGNEKLINEKGQYVAIDENGVEYPVDEDGNRIDDPDIESAVFLDDDGNEVCLGEDGELIVKTPALVQAEAEIQSEETTDEESEDKPKKTRKKAV